MYTGPISANISQVFPPPVMEARRWLSKAIFPADRPLLNLSQAAPVKPPPMSLRNAMAEAALEDDTHVYGPVLGNPVLREEIASQWSDIYRGKIYRDNVAITSGCNQAFCAAITTIASEGDAVILPTPWYFNHKMWLDMVGVETRLLPCSRDMLPDPDDAKALIDDKVKAIVLVTPNNPTGAEYPDDLIQSFHSLSRDHGLALIIDETYRDFCSNNGPPHTLFTDTDWHSEVIHLYSFSKVFRLTGHRVGALLASPERLEQVEKFLDTVTICPNQMAQKAALFGLCNLSEFVAGERQEILNRRSWVSNGFDKLEGWKLLGAGAYFAYVEHPYDISSHKLVQLLVNEQSLLLLPGTMFAPSGTDGSAEKQIRVAFANVDRNGINTLFERLASFTNG